MNWRKIRKEKGRKKVRQMRWTRWSTMKQSNFRRKRKKRLRRRPMGECFQDFFFKWAVSKKMTSWLANWFDQSDYKTSEGRVNIASGRSPAGVCCYDNSSLRMLLEFLCALTSDALRECWKFCSNFLKLSSHISYVVFFQCRLIFFS